MLPEKEEEGSKGDTGKSPSSKSSKAVVLYNTIKERQKWGRQSKWLGGQRAVLTWETESRALHAPNTRSTQLQRVGSGSSAKHNNHPQNRNQSIPQSTAEWGRDTVFIFSLWLDLRSQLSQQLINKKKVQVVLNLHK